jgi:long-chain acyl-CoA synthetase
MTSRKIEQEIAEIEAEIKGQTVCHRIERNARLYADKPALSWKVNGSWHTRTWGEAREEAKRVALGLMELGLDKGDFGAIMARNRPEHVIADQGIMHAAATPVSLYNTLAPDQIQYIVAHCEAKVAIVEGPDFLQRFVEVKDQLPGLQRVVVIDGGGAGSDLDWVMTWEELIASGEEALGRDPGRFDESWKRVQPEDPATLIYTSGTTGPPKGVVLTHRNAVWTAVAGIRAVENPLHQNGLSYLPLAHSAERLFSYYIGIENAGHGYFCPEILEVREYLPEVRPYAFLGVPRVWEKFEAGIMAKVTEEPDEKKRNIALKAIAAGREAQALRVEGKSIPLGLKLKVILFDKLVFSKIRSAIGLDKCVVPISGAAPISTETINFFRALGIPLVEGYGLSETTAGGTVGRPQNFKVGTVGQPLPGVEFKTIEDGELVMRGGCVTAGYYKEPEQTAEAFKEDGWFHTGDIAQIDHEGFVTIVDRKKELIITAGGKNISPANLENLLKRHPLVGQAAVIGDKRKFISALIVLDAEIAPGWAAHNGLEFTDIAQLSQEERVKEEIQKAVDAANKQVSNVEKVKRFKVLPTEWTPFSEELTPTMKLKRRVIHEKYSGEIDEIYADA